MLGEGERKTTGLVGKKKREDTPGNSRKKGNAKGGRDFSPSSPRVKRDLVGGEKKNVKKKKWKTEKGAGLGFSHQGLKNAA